MGTIQAGVGINSGINIGQIVDALINAQKGTINRFTTRVSDYSTTRDSINTLSANLLSLSSPLAQLSTPNSFQKRSVTNSNTDSLQVIANKDASFGSYTFRAVKKSVAQEVTSKGFAAPESTAGAGTITIAHGGQVDRRVVLDYLNGGTGISRGQFRITDRSGGSAVIDVSDALTVDDILTTINNHSEIAVQAKVEGDHFVLTDVSGQTTGNLTVTDLNGGQAASSLGLAGTVAGSKLTGSDVYAASDLFQLTQINDGNAPRIKTGVDTLRITLTDDSTVDVNLNGAITVGDVISKINSDEDNAGKVTASISNGRLVLQDLTAGGGTQSLHVENLNGSSAVRELGLDTTASGQVLTGARLTGGLNSVLLRNLNGGKGITQLGTLSLTDRTGTTADVDLSSAETLDDVLSAINNATSSGSVKLQLEATLNSSRTGIVITDKSGSTANHLVIADSGGATLASELNIAVDADQTSVSSGNLHRQYINANTKLESFAKNGSLSRSGFIVTDSNSIGYLISLSSGVQSVGDLIDKISSSTGGKVTAQLNDRGDGIELIDQAGGTGKLSVVEFGGSSASDLRLTGTAELGSDSKYHLVAHEAVQVSIEATDTLVNIATKLSDAGAGFKAAVGNYGSAINPTRLLLRANAVGASQGFVIDEQGVNLGLTTTVKADDTVLRVGASGPGSYLLSSSDTRFVNAAPGVTVTVLNPSTTDNTITTAPDNSIASNALDSFVTAYNNLLDQIGTLTKFDTTTGERGPLQGNNLVLRIQQRLEDTLNKVIGSSSSPVRSLADIGIKVLDGGKLSLDTDRLAAQLADHPDEVTKLFTDSTNGIGKALADSVKSFTDSIDGTLTLAAKSAQDNIDVLNVRIDALNQILDQRKQTLTEKYIQMDQVIGQLQTQQNSISQIKPLTVASSSN